MKKTTQEEAVSQINDLQNRLSLYQNQGVSFDDMPLVLEFIYRWCFWCCDEVL